MPGARGTGRGFGFRQINPTPAAPPPGEPERPAPPSPNRDRSNDNDSKIMGGGGGLTDWPLKELLAAREGNNAKCKGDGEVINNVILFTPLLRTLACPRLIFISDDGLFLFSILKVIDFTIIN